MTGCGCLAHDAQICANIQKGRVLRRGSNVYQYPKACCCACHGPKEAEITESDISFLTGDAKPFRSTGKM